MFLSLIQATNDSCNKVQNLIAQNKSNEVVLKELHLLYYFFGVICRYSKSHINNNKIKDNLEFTKAELRELVEKPHSERDTMWNKDIKRCFIDLQEHINYIKHSNERLD